MNKKINWSVFLMMIFMILPVFFILPKQKVESQSQIDKVVKPVKSDDKYYVNTPTNPIAAQNLQVYSDVNLTRKVGQISAHTKLNLTKIDGKSFQLSDGKYISANMKNVVSDLVLSTKSVNQTVYITSKTTTYYNPVTQYENQSFGQIAANQSFTADKFATTYSGNYYEIQLSNGTKAWIDENATSLENPKFAAVQTMLNQKYKNSNYSITVKQIDSKFTVGVNQNEELYGASLGKLPILYWTQKRLNEGQISLSDNLLYSNQINTWNGAYDPAGTGTLPEIPDNKSYNLLDVINRTAKVSDNVGSNLLAYYETGQFNPQYQKAIDEIAGQHWNPDTREISSLMVANVLNALYDEGGACFNALIGTSFDNIKIKAGLPSNIPVAHKIGDADSYNHDAAVVFAQNPYILVVETDGASNQQISQISTDVYNILK